jgi:predicted O-methyltransferase YrrM
MRRTELRTAFRYSYMALGKPGWWFEFLRGGRVGLLSRMVADSIAIVSTVRVLSVRETLRAPPVTPLGRMGAHQEYLYRLIRATQPKIVVETGVYRGVSSAFALAALRDNGDGKLVSIDLPSASYTIRETGMVDSSPLLRNEEVGFVIPSDLRRLWTLRVGDVRHELPRLLTEEPAIDMFYHDSEHTYDTMMWEYEQALPHIKTGGLLTSDDVGWNAAFPDFTRKHGLADSTIILNRFGVAVVSR